MNYVGFSLRHLDDSAILQNREREVDIGMMKTHNEIYIAALPINLSL